MQIYCRPDYGPTFGQGLDLRVNLQNKTFSHLLKNLRTTEAAIFGPVKSLNEVEVFAADDFCEFCTQYTRNSGGWGRGLANASANCWQWIHRDCTHAHVITDQRCLNLLGSR